MATKTKTKKKMTRTTEKQKLEKLKKEKAKKRLVRMKNQPEPHANRKAKKSTKKWANPTPYEIYEEQPIPWTRPHAKDIVFPFLGMEVGQNFEFWRESHRGQNVYSATVSFCSEPDNFHKKFVVRKIGLETRAGIEWTRWGCWREEDLDAKEVAQKKIDFKRKRENIIKTRRDAAKAKKKGN